MPEGLRTRLTLTFGGLTLLALAVSAVLVVGTLERLLLDRLSQDLEAQARLVAGQVAGDLLEGELGRVEQALIRVDGATAARAVAVDARGQLVGASEPEERRQAGRPAAQAGFDRALNGQVVRETQARRGPEGEVLYVVVPADVDGVVVGAVRLAYQLRDVEQTITQLNVGVATGALGTAAAAAALAATFAGAITTPIGALSRAARALASGDLDQQVSLPARGEVGQLIVAFNEMAARLRAFEAARREFAADISHELHALAGAMQTAAEALARGADREPALRARLVDGLVGHTRRLGRLADDLLELARLEGGRLALDFRPVSLAAVARQAVAEWAAEATRRGVTLEAETEAEPVVVGDQERLVQACGNLVENALKYTPPGGRVDVRVACAPDGSRVLEVRDDGQGIPAEELPRIFHRFYRVEGRSGEGPSGTGLGLAIVDRIVRAHGGSVTVTSALGQGSTFQVRLPVYVPEHQSTSDQPPTSVNS